MLADGARAYWYGGSASCPSLWAEAAIVSSYLYCPDRHNRFRIRTSRQPPSSTRSVALSYYLVSQEPCALMKIHQFTLIAILSSAIAILTGATLAKEKAAMQQTMPTRD